ncbi:MAG: U32 family peptidase [Treponema sp.]|jgi:putative protease|nr:U32 family peptidase [Treponema sp.]
MNTIELLAPAGSDEALDAAIRAGADAVYLGVKDFNARMRAANFTYAQVEAGIRMLHRMGRRCYITVNTVFEQREADRMYQLLKYLSRIGPDGLIVQDFGAVYMARQYFPSLKLHASTQMNIASSGGVNVLSRSGISRVVLARELALDEIKELRSKTSSELEVFVHGALCISESGLCLFSSFLGGRSANRGMCTQACRRLYRAADDAAAGASEEGYFFSPADLQLIEHIPILADTGINAFKIEGRMKSAGYTGTVVSAYRTVIDALGGSDEQIADAVEQGKQILRYDFARKKTVFHYDSHTALSFLNPRQTGGTGMALGKILKLRKKENEYQGLIARGDIPVSEGDLIRIHSADDCRRISYKLLSVEVERADSGMWVSIPRDFTVGDDVFLIQTTEKTKRYHPPIIRIGHGPGYEKAPLVDLMARRHTGNSANNAKIEKSVKSEKSTKYVKKTKSMPEGLYAAVSHTDDLYAVQSIKPVKVLLTLNTRTLAYLLSMTNKQKPPLPFHADDTILVLEPYFPQALEVSFAESIPRLCREGYRTFEINNPAHVSLFRNSGAALIAGPYLYAFNRFAAAFVQDFGVDYIVSPLENNRQNLERTFERQERSSVFVTVFAYPALFRIRNDLSLLYGWSRFGVTQGEYFSLITEPDKAGSGGTGGGSGGGSLVVPEIPFSIVDKIPFLSEAGFGRFILDFSGPALKKKDYRTVMTSAKEGTPLPNISRFNWKNGFFKDNKK